MRGSSVALLCVLIVGAKKYVVTVKHPRTPVGRPDHLEIPVGMEAHKSPMGVIRNLLQNESHGIELETDAAINLNRYLFNQTDRLIYASPGSCDQGVKYFLLEKEISDQQLEDIKANPKSSESSQYETVLVELEKLDEKCNDSNAIVAARLYELYCNKKKDEDARTPLTSSSELPFIISPQPTTPRGPALGGAPLRPSAAPPSPRTPTTPTSATTPAAPFTPISTPTPSTLSATPINISSSSSSIPDIAHLAPPANGIHRKEI